MKLRLGNILPILALFFIMSCGDGPKYMKPDDDNDSGYDDDFDENGGSGYSSNDVMYVGGLSRLKDSVKDSIDKTKLKTLLNNLKIDKSDTSTFSFETISDYLSKDETGADIVVATDLNTKIDELNKILKNYDKIENQKDFEKLFKNSENINKILATSSGQTKKKLTKDLLDKNDSDIDEIEAFSRGNETNFIKLYKNVPKVLDNINKLDTDVINNDATIDKFKEIYTRHSLNFYNQFSIAAGKSLTKDKIDRFHKVFTIVETSYPIVNHLVSTKGIKGLMKLSTIHQHCDDHAVFIKMLTLLTENFTTEVDICDAHAILKNTNNDQAKIFVGICEYLKKDAGTDFAFVNAFDKDDVAIFTQSNFDKLKKYNDNIIPSTNLCTFLEEIDHFIDQEDIDTIGSINQLYTDFNTLKNSTAAHKNSIDQIAQRVTTTLYQNLLDEKKSKKLFANKSDILLETDPTKYEFKTNKDDSYITIFGKRLYLGKKGWGASYYYADEPDTSKFSIKALIKNQLLT